MKKNNIWKKSLVFGILLLLIGVNVFQSTGKLADEETFLKVSRSNIIYVGGSGPGNYSDIQSAINAANDGDTIFVYSGTYEENVNINKKISLIGEDKDTTIIQGSDESDSTVQVTANWSNITKFTIKNGGTFSAGIMVEANNCLICDTILTDNQDKGLWLQESENTNIFDNQFFDNSHGIYLYYSDNNIISNNNASDNRDNGILCYKSNNNDFIENFVNSNEQIGIYLFLDCDYNNILDNTVNSNDGGIRLYNSDENMIYNNSVCDNGAPDKDGGIVCYYSNNNDVLCNFINSNKNQGIFLEMAISNIIANNTVLNNTNYGIRCKSSENNIIYHNNLIENTQNADDDNTNTWYNSELEQGNFWDDYTGEDDDGDGIGDTPYEIPGDSNQDEYPLMTQYGLPHADFFYTISGNNVTFNGSRSYDYNGIITSYEWDFDDGSNGTGLTVIHTYSEWGIYNVTLTISDDDNNIDSTIKTIIIDFILPEIIDNTPDIGYTGDDFTFNATITDNLGITEALVAYRYGDSPQKNVDMNNTVGDFWEATIIIEDTLEKIYYRIFAWDVSDNQNQSDLGNVTIYDNDPPEISDVNADPWVQMTGEYVNISAAVIDNIDLSEVYLYIIYPDSTVDNISIKQNKIDDTYYGNRIYNQDGDHTYHIWAKDSSGNTKTSDDYTFKIVLGVPPEDPQINGPSSGKIETPISYTFSSIDPDGDDVFYYIEWGDGEIEDWIGPYESGDVITVDHTWSVKGDYSIRAKAKDTKDLQSGWSSLDITIPKNKPFNYNFPLLSWFLDRFPNAFPILRQVLGL